MLDDQLDVAVFQEYLNKDPEGIYNTEFKKAFDFLDSMEIQKSHDIFLKLAESGHRVSQCNVAMIYESYPPLHSDERKIYWHQKASNQDYAPSHCFLGQIYARGDGVPAEPRKGFELLSKAANAGFPKAYHNLSLLYGQGVGVQANIDKAIELMKLAVEKDHSKLEPAFNILSLGRLYLEKGEQVKAQGCFDEAIRIDPKMEQMVMVLKMEKYLGDNPQTQQKNEGCFIATAIYGSPESPEIQILREFRDEKLSKTTFGRSVVDWYYRLSPPIADYLFKKTLLKNILRLIFFSPLIRLLKLTRKT